MSVTITSEVAEVDMTFSVDVAFARYAADPSVGYRGGVEIDSVKINGQVISLSPKKFEWLENYLIENP